MNKKFTVSIKLLSDTCLGEGIGNGTDVDVISSFDEYGFPVIPAKRIKGLLREKALMLSKNGLYENEEVISLFGGLNGNTGRLQIENAALCDIEKLMPVTKDYKPYQIRKTYTNKRAQTAIDDEGIAKKLSLRTIETVNKGCKFSCNVIVNDCKENDIEILEKSFKLLRSIGIDKNRGLGEVKCELNKGSIKEFGELKDLKYSHGGEKQKLCYTLELLQDVAFKSDSAIQNLSYIPGSALQGFFANKLKDFEFFDDVIFNDLEFLNAYISDGEKRFLPCSASLVGIKNEDKKVYSLADNYGRKDDKQYVAVNGYGAFDGDNKYIKKSVLTGSEYHINKGNKDLFSFTMIKKKQVFKGYIVGSKGALELVKEVLSAFDDTIYIGSSTTAQYGKCKMTVNCCETDNNLSVNQGENIVVELLSDAVCVDEYGNNTGNIEALLCELKKKDIKFGSNIPFLKSGIVGGFNAKWKMPKIQKQVFLKGSVLVLKNCTAVQLPENAMIGMDNSEGYGEIVFRKQRNNNEFETEKAEDKQESFGEANSQEAKDLIAKIEDNEEIQKMKREASKFAEEKFKNISDLSNSSAMRIMNLYLSIDRKNEPDKFEKFMSEIKNFENNNERCIMANDRTKKLKFDELYKTGDRDKMFDVFVRSFIRRLKEMYQLDKREGEAHE